MTAVLDLDLERPGRHWGALRIPWSHDASAYGQVVVPVCCLAGARPGPTVLLTAGVHGDEWEGQVALRDLARTLDPAGLRGRVLLVPTAHPAAAAAGRRTSPVDGGNLARLFPGSTEGGLTAQLADGIALLLLPLADMVLDLHGGGGSLDYLPCAWGRLPPDPALAARVLDALLALGVERTVVVDSSTRGTLIAHALELGIPAVGTEIGGAGALHRDTLAVAETVVRRFLAHAGVLPAEPAGATRLLRVLPGHYLRSPGRGLFQPSFRLNEQVAAGQPAGFLHDLDHPDREPEALRWPSAGLVICRRAPAPAALGDVLAHLAEDADRHGLVPA